MAVTASREQTWSTRSRPTKGNMPAALPVFTGGLNTVGSGKTIADNECQVLINLEPDIDGTLVTRPPIIRGDNAYQNTWHEPLGYVQRAGSTSLIVAFPLQGVTRALNLTSGGWTQIAPFVASAFVQYNNRIYMSCEARAGGYWDMANGGYNDLSSMPAMSGLTMYNNRFFGFATANSQNNNSILYWSDLDVSGTSSSNWNTAINVLLVAQGDGQWITGLIVDSSGLLILKNGSTWRFSYSTGGPGAGTLVVVSPTVGADTRWSWAVVGTTYAVFSDGALYQMLNGRYYDLSSSKIKFLSRSLEGLTLNYSSAVSIFAGRIIVWFYGRLYSYSTVTKTWSEWQSYDTYACRFMQAPASFTGAQVLRAYVTSGTQEANRYRLYYIDDQRMQNGIVEVGGYAWQLMSKEFDFGDQFDLKRLMYWQIACKINSAIVGIVFPITLAGGAPSWDDMSLLDWDTLSLGNYDNPTYIVPEAIDNVIFPTATPTDARVRFRSPVKFLSAAFQLSGTIDGSTVTSPARLYELTAYTRVQNRTIQKVS